MKHFSFFQDAALLGRHHADMRLVTEPAHAVDLTATLEDAGGWTPEPLRASVAQTGGIWRVNGETITPMDRLAHLLMRPLG